jgi:hypothetical protein
MANTSTQALSPDGVVEAGSRISVKLRSERSVKTLERCSRLRLRFAVVA